MKFINLFLLLSVSFFAKAQIDPNYKFPGKGLKQHDFLYAGEWDIRKPTAQSMFLVRGGKVVWQYSIPLKTATGSIQEFGDATLLSNGNIVYACMSGAGIITPEKNILAIYLCTGNRNAFLPADWERQCFDGFEWYCWQSINL